MQTQPFNGFNFGTIGDTHTVVADISFNGNGVTGSIRVRPRRRSQRTPAVADPPCELAHHRGKISELAGVPPVQLPLSDSSYPDQDPLRSLLKIGVDQDTAHRLAGSFPASRVSQVCQVAATKRNPSGFAIRALQGDWNL